MSGRLYVTPVLKRSMDAQPAAATDSYPHFELTVRQREVLKLLAKGYSMKQVAAHLGFAARTVAFHKYKMMGKFRLANNAELVQFAIRQRLIT